MLKTSVGCSSKHFGLLVPDGRFTFSHAACGPAGEPYYPLPWARDASYSFLGTPEEILALLREVGFTQIQNLDENSEAFRCSRPGTGRCRRQRDFGRRHATTPSQFCAVRPRRTAGANAGRRSTPLMKLPSISAKSAQGQTRTSSLGAGCPLPPSADIGPGRAVQHRSDERPRKADQARRRKA